MRCERSQQQAKHSTSVCCAHALRHKKRSATLCVQWSESVCVNDVGNDFNFALCALFVDFIFSALPAKDAMTSSSLLSKETRRGKSYAAHNACRHLSTRTHTRFLCYVVLPPCASAANRPPNTGAKGNRATSSFARVYSGAHAAPAACSSVTACVVLCRCAAEDGERFQECSRCCCGWSCAFV